MLSLLRTTLHPSGPHISYGCWTEIEQCLGGVVLAAGAQTYSRLLCEPTDGSLLRQGGTMQIEVQAVTAVNRAIAAAVLLLGGLLNVWC